MRATYQKQNGEVVISTLPYQVSRNRILEQISAQMLTKKLTAVSDTCDESDHENSIRLVISLRSNRVNIDKLRCICLLP